MSLTLSEEHEQEMSITESLTEDDDLAEENGNYLNYSRLSKNVVKFLKMTGIRLSVFNHIFFPGIEPFLMEKRKNQGPKWKLSIKEEALLVLVYLRQGLSFNELGHMAGLSECRVRRNILSDSDRIRNKKISRRRILLYHKSVCNLFYTLLSNNNLCFLIPIFY